MIVLKDAEGKRLLKKFSEPRSPTKWDVSRRRLPTDEPEEFQRLVAYCVQDVLSEQSISAYVPELSPFMQEVWACDQRINDRGIGVDMEGVENCIAIIEQAKTLYTKDLIRLTGGVVTSASQVAKIVEWLHSRGIHLNALDAEEVEHGLKISAPDSDEHKVLRIRQRLASASVKKLYAMRHRAYRGRLHGLYGFHAARTGRWNGVGPQPQNFPRPLPEFEDFAEAEKALEVMKQRSLDALLRAYPDLDPLDVVASCLRSLLVAEPGYEMICSDFTAIEGVVLACLANEQWRIDVFKSGGPMYEVSASRIFKVPLEDFPRYKKEHGKHHPLRQKGKQAELACQYLGWIGAWKNFGTGDETDDEIKQMILAWRAASPNIVEFGGGQTRGRFRSARPELYGLEGAVVAAIRNPGSAFSCGSITYVVERGTLFCRLPSGRFLTYHQPQIAPSRRDWAQPWEVEITFSGWNTNPKQGALGWVRMQTYAGKLMENVTQAVAYDFQAHGIMQLERAGYPVVLHSHDEIASERRVGEGSVEEFERIVNTLPDWAVLPDGSPWPIKMSGGWRGWRYRK